MMLPHFTMLIADTAVTLGTALGLWISFRVMAYPDLALEQGFVLGGAMLAVCAQHALPPWIVFLVAVPIAVVAALFCSAMRFHFRLPPIIVSLSMGCMYYSMTLFSFGSASVDLSSRIARISPVVAGAISLIVLASVSVVWAVLLRTRRGLQVLAAGCNPVLARSHEQSTTLNYAIGLSFAFYYTYAAGALFTWRGLTIESSHGAGLLVSSILVVVVTSALTPRVRPILNIGCLCAVALLYGLMQQTLLQFQVPANLVRGITGALLLFILALLSFVSTRGLLPILRLLR
jgi:putative tryptophan/tyrosine transport system permease protein